MILRAWTPSTGWMNGQFSISLAPRDPLQGLQMVEGISLGQGVWESVLLMSSIEPSAWCGTGTSMQQL